MESQILTTVNSNNVEMIVVHQKKRIKTLTPEQLKQYLNKELSIESISYPYSLINRHIVIEGLEVYKKPVMEIVTKQHKHILEAFNTTDELVDRLMEVYSDGVLVVQ